MGPTMVCNLMPVRLERKKAVHLLGRQFFDTVDAKRHSRPKVTQNRTRREPVGDETIIEG